MLTPPQPAPAQFETAEPDIVDGFTYSMTDVLLPTSFRAQCLAQMEMLRRAKGYTARWYTAPNNNDEPQPAFNQTKFQINITPGSYIWGFNIWYPGFAQSDLVHILITDACSELQFSSDYVIAQQIVTRQLRNRAAPMLFPQPRLISEPGLVNVEVYLGTIGSDSATEAIQLVLYTAEPCGALYNWSKR